MAGGDKHNAIPRELIVRLVTNSNNIDDLKSWFKNAEADVKNEFKPVEPDLNLTIKQSSGPLSDVLESRCQAGLLSLLFALPHGPLAMSREIKDLVETSNNVAALRYDGDTAAILCSSRSSNGAALQAVKDKLTAIAFLAGAEIDQPQGYPGWMPNVDSNVLNIAMNTFKELTANEASFEAVHAGLECGIIGEKFPGMDMISIGPTIKHPHSPDERVHVESVATFFNHLVMILAKLAQDQ
jgi:dipeptidase D